MVRCRRCGAENYAIDMWCSNCSHHLDWAPPEVTASESAADAVPVAEPVVAGALAEPEVAEPEVAEPEVAEPEIAEPGVAEPGVAEAEVATPIAEPVAVAPAAVAATEGSRNSELIPAAAPPARTSRRRQPVPVWVFAAAAAALLAVVLALPVAGRFKAASRQEAALRLPVTAGVNQATPVASPSPSVVAVEPSPSPSATPVQPVPQPPIVQQPLGQPVVPGPAFQRAAGDPTRTVAGFYQAVAAHKFDAAAALWSARMQANYPPDEFINRRFAYTQQMDLRQARTLGNNGQVATVYIDLIEVYAGSTRHWVGTWQLVRTSSGWLLDQPSLRAAA